MIKYLLTLVVLALGAIAYFVVNQKEPVVVPVVVAVPIPVPVQIAFTNYVCDGNKNLSATYYDLPNAVVATSEAGPTPTGSVTINLPANRTVTLNQTISASGVRYTNTDQSIEFWNKGREVLFTEKTVASDLYTNCIEIAEETPEKTTAYHNGTLGFTLRHAPDYTVDEAYVYKALGPGKSIPGIKFTIPAALATGTNLAATTYLSIETLPLTASTTSSCLAGPFLGGTVSSTAIVASNNITYSVATSSDAAAGNHFEETVYALTTADTCLAIRYLTHYTPLENYASGTVKAYDVVALKRSFDTIRESLIVK